MARKKYIYPLIAMISSIIISLVFAEIIIRSFFPEQEAMRWHLSNDRYGFVMKQNFIQEYHYIDSDYTMEVRTNSLGLRDKEYDLTKTDKKRILLLGDSFTFGYAVDVEDNFDNKLEKLLNKEGDQWIVINAGHGGWGTLQESLYARDHFGLISPDIIVLTFCGNDPTDDILFTQERHDSEKGVFYFPGKVFIRNHSHLYRLVHRAYLILSNRWTLNDKLRNVEDSAGVFIDEQSATVITEEDWKNTLGHISDLHKYFLAFNPDGILLVQATAPLDQNIRKNLSTLTNGENLFYVDLYEEVSRLRPEQMRLPYDGHWSPSMHTIAAEHLFETILRLDNHAKGIDGESTIHREAGD